METSLRKLKLERTLSLQTCFPENFSAPGSGTSSDHFPANGIGSGGSNCSTAQHHIVSVQLSYSGNIPIGADLSTIQNVADQMTYEAHIHAKTPDARGEASTPSAKNLTMYVPLYKAAFRGDWKMANAFFKQHPEALTARITKGWECALHIAAGAKQLKFVEELVELMDPPALAAQNKFGNTALCFAAASGITKIAQVMVAKNSNLPMIRGSKGVTPLHMAALLGQQDMVWYLLSVTDPKYLTKEDYVSLIIATISTDLYDVALLILQDKPGLAIERDPNGETALHVLARKPSAFSSKEGLNFWQKCIFPCKVPPS